MKENILQLNRRNSTQYEIDGDTLRCEVKIAGKTSRFSTNLDQVGMVLDANREYEVQEKQFSDADTAKRLVIIVALIFAPIFIAGTNSIRVLDVLGGLVFLLAIVLAVNYFYIAISRPVMCREYYCEKLTLRFYVRNNQDESEVAHFMDVLEKKLAAIHGVRKSKLGETPNNTH